MEKEPELPEELRLDQEGYPSPPAARPPARPPPFLVQFAGQLDAGDQMRLRAQYGLRLSDYVAEATYLERLGPETVVVLRDDPLVRAVVPYHPAFRIEPGLEERHAARSPEALEREPGWAFVVIGFAQASADELRAEVERLGLEVAAANEEGAERVPRLVVRANGSADAARLARLPEVRWVEDVGEVTLNNFATSWVIQSNEPPRKTVWEHGIRGDGQVIGHIDGPIDMAHCFFRDDGDNTPRPAHRKVVGLRHVAATSINPEHGTFSAGCAAGEDVGHDALSQHPNLQNGNAPRSKLSHSYVRDLDIAGGASTFLNLLEAAHADGARIHTNSWDDKTKIGYTVLSVNVDRFTYGDPDRADDDHEDDLVVIGPNNLGTIHPPDTAKNAVVVNATRQTPNQGQFLSGIKQFTPDNRRKPDLMAPGENIVSAANGTPCDVRTDNGTSFAAPAVAGAAALVREYYLRGYYPSGKAQPAHALTPTGALLKATLLNATVDMSGIPGYPGDAASGEGWGRLLLENALYFEGDARTLKVWDVRHAKGLEQKEVFWERFWVDSDAEPLKITLVWTDPPGGLGSDQPVVNDLDLRVKAPDGRVFVGNQFSVAGESLTAGNPDSVNNVEMVIVNVPPRGTWDLTVTATKVSQGKPHGKTGRRVQGYALVATGRISNPCFVAGAVYGGQAHADVVLLRAWRDEHLEPGARGRRAMGALATVYDRAGPWLAMQVARRPRLAGALRRLGFEPLAAALRRRRTGR